jgi:four helix bundle protein
MNNENKPRALPHHRLVAWEVAGQLLLTIKEAEIGSGKIREQAMRAAVSTCCNIAEAASRTSPADKKRVFGIARGECGEAVGVIEVGALAGYVERSVAERCVQLGDRLYALLPGLAR